MAAPRGGRMHSARLQGAAIAREETSLGLQGVEGRGREGNGGSSNPLRYVLTHSQQRKRHIQSTRLTVFVYVMCKPTSAPERGGNGEGG